MVYNRIRLKVVAEKYLNVYKRNERSPKLKTKKKNKKSVFGKTISIFFRFKIKNNREWV